MQSRRNLCAWILTAALVGTGSAGASAAAKPEYLPLQDEQVGYSLRYPRSWKVERGPVGATEFAAGAHCTSVRIVDFAPPVASGAGFILHSFVQICARPRTDASGLDEFMRRTYRGSLLGQFERAQIGGARAYTAREADQHVFFLQTAAYRLQIYAAVAARPEQRALRRAQVRRILRSFALN